MITTQAIQLRIWDYLEPTKDTVVTEPGPLQVPATLDNALIETNFKLEIEEYRDQKAKYLLADTNLAIMRTYICNLVDSLHLQDLASRIVNLSRSSKSASAQRTTHELARYSITMKPSRKQPNLRILSSRSINGRRLSAIG
jgi:hypothetical protein